MMKKSELLTILKSHMSDTIRDSNDTLKQFNLAMLRDYNQELYGNEEKNHSSVISSDVYDNVESDMPTFARVFLGHNEILKFVPLNANDVQECEEKTKYANYLIRGQRDSFKVLHDLLKEPGFSKCAVAKYFIEEKTIVEYVTYENLSQEELALVMSDLKNGDKATKVEIDQRYDSDSKDIYNVKFRISRKIKKTTIASVPPECFFITRGASSKDSAQVVGDICTKTKGELIAEGYPKELVKGLEVSSSDKGSQYLYERFKDQGGYDQKSGYHWTNDRVDIENCYALIDYDEDGIPERRYIQKCGDDILENEPFNHVPYAIFSQILMPHSAIGKSRGEQAARYQLQKTALKRGLMDNVYSVNRPRFAVDDSAGSSAGGRVDLDDLLTHQIGGIVRIDGNPMEHIMPLETPYIGDKALQVIQYLDSEKANTLGLMMSNQGLDADKFHNETATRFNGINDASIAKIELVSRVYAETGFRDLFEGVIWLAQHYQDTACEIMVLGKPLTVDPRKWRYEHYCQSQVGIGAGDSGEAIENLSVMLQTQLNLIQTGSTVADYKKVYNTLVDIARAMGKPDPGRYFNDPEQPDQILYAQNQQLQIQVQQLQQQLQAAANPLADAAEITAKARLIEAQSKKDQFSQKLKQDDDHFTATLAKDITKLELDANRQLPGGLV